MIKYLTAAASLKLFSATGGTKRFYRLMANGLGSRWRRRGTINGDYVDRVGHILRLAAEHDAIRDGQRLLEVGTGWIHWEATVLRLFYDVEVTLFDVKDCRQFGAYQRHLQQLAPVIHELSDVDPERKERALETLDAICGLESFDEIYERLGFRYVVDAAGTLDKFNDESFDLVFSWDVLEHVDRDVLCWLLNDFRRVLTPGGHAIHKIDLSDHLSHYDRALPLKNYLRYSDRTWRRFFQNDLQYFNRVQRPEWLQRFADSGLETRFEQSIGESLGPIRVHPCYASLSWEDRECVWLIVVHQKPVAVPEPAGAIE